MIDEKYIKQQLEHIKTTQAHLERWLDLDRVEEITGEMMTSFKGLTDHVIKRDINIISREILGGSVEDLMKGDV
jgi:hypothetical protein